eukprot:9850792-Alexandrium_andersonii.AAC.1
MLKSACRVMKQLHRFQQILRRKQLCVKHRGARRVTCKSIQQQQLRGWGSAFGPKHCPKAL